MHKRPLTVTPAVRAADRRLGVLKVGRETGEILVAPPLGEIASFLGRVGLFELGGRLFPRIVLLLVALVALVALVGPAPLALPGLLDLLAFLVVLAPVFSVYQDILAARVCLVSGLVRLGSVLLRGTRDQDESALRVMFVHGQQDRVLVYVATVLGLLVRRGRDDGVGVLLGQRFLLILDIWGRGPFAARGGPVGAGVWPGEFVGAARRIVAGAGGACGQQRGPLSCPCCALKTRETERVSGRRTGVGSSSGRSSRTPSLGVNQYRPSQPCFQDRIISLGRRVVGRLGMGGHTGCGVGCGAKR